MRPRVLVLGAYGAFGTHVCERLAHLGGVDLVIAGRSEEKARDFAAGLSSRFKVAAEPIALDASSMQASDIAPLRVTVVINASGPFQAQDYAVARAAIGVGAHYVDLCDARAFAVGISALDQEARGAGVLVTSGASSVPALSASAVDAQLGAFTKLRSITSVISPGWR